MKTKHKLYISLTFAFCLHLMADQDQNPAMNEPEKFVWQNLFIPINKAAGIGQNTIWETWASDEDTFPASPDPAHPPVWPSTTSKRLRPVRQLQLMDLERSRDLQDEAKLFNAPGGTDSSAWR